MKLNNNDDSHNSGLNLLIYNMLLDIESHPAWVCGLKLNMSLTTESVLLVTPCVGVWIETLLTLPTEHRLLSHPAWVCGLKLCSIIIALRQRLSHPAWVCGLKLPIRITTERI